MQSHQATKWYDFAPKPATRPMLIKQSVNTVGGFKLASMVPYVRDYGRFLSPTKLYFCGLIQNQFIIQN